ncbi:class I SAM-dependent methyltransferase [Hoyosella altamirensis]|uniref:2-polyprenyl-3-methyl-5-hydroxy-6-metoxy-1, 4-benzoquinol methylase n=1 Tax=Hoyosella altamirensis TaxID=616997 RepID=A0A839RGA4_9ACTN|nr:class I SAM-dependent methyltransferase [Hoyosella altamirensis]MBB3035752.1 2-polyprenyl-3-methyl-5-hydroxy-6-metoxy-1,4-benzoquinol methylase [Hoyosella altamirensis]
MTTSAAVTEAFTERVFRSVLGAAETQAIYLGMQLGYYTALSDGGSLTAAELARRTETAPRYAREWLEHQAVCGYLHVDDVSADQEERRFTLPPEHAEVLACEGSLNYIAPFSQLFAATSQRLEDLVHAYRTGTGVSWEQFGTDAREGQAAANRPLFLGPLGKEYLPSIPSIEQALRAGGTVADIGCGYGWSSIGIAQAYPDATVDGIDTDIASIVKARAVAESYGVSDRVSFSATMPGPDRSAQYDLVCAFECIHDMSDPVAVLREMRRLVRPDGTVLVMDERVAHEFTAPGDEVEQLMYGYSLLCCLPDGLSHEHSVGTGTVMRPATLDKYARQAGFSGIEIYDIENDFFRFYRLVQS